MTTGLLVSLENDTCIGATKTEVVAHYRVQIRGFATFKQDGKTINYWIEYVNIGRSSHKAIFQHQKTVDRLLHTRSPQ